MTLLAHDDVLLVCKQVKAEEDTKRLAQIARDADAQVTAGCFGCLKVL